MYYAQRIAKQGWVKSMSHAGFTAQLRKTRRLPDNGHTHGLPAGDPIPIFPIATLPGAPKEWIREAGTYVCPVDTEWGLWFDWTSNDNLNTAVLASVKGMNPVTGQRIENLALEQYADKCPIHDKPFAHGRLCEECGYEWPPQNYICSPNTLWWDGFRQPDGTVRQFFFTDEEKRDIASLVIGKENTVPAFGFAFYRPKNPRSVPQQTSRRLMGGYGGQSVVISSFHGGLSQFGGDNYLCSPQESSASHNPSSSGSTSSFQSNFVSGDMSILSRVQDSELKEDELQYNDEDSVSSFMEEFTSDEEIFDGEEVKAPESKPKKSKDVSVGAGASIDQDLASDSLGLEGWQETESAVIRLYFCFEEQFEKIVKVGGIKELVSNPKGYLDKLPIG